MAMRCPTCKRKTDGDHRNCPYCGEPVPERIAGTLRTSTILISSDDTESVYHSVREVPEPLRKKLLRSTSGTNSRTILIADRRGEQHIARALKNLPGAPPVTPDSALSGMPSATSPKLTPAQAAGILLAGATGLVAWLLLFRR
jgi:hypothetical protein